MKITFTLITLTFALLLSGCNLLADSYLGYNYSGKSVYYGDFSEIKTVDEIAPWLKAHIIYDASNSGVFHNPADTIGSGRGCCTDFTIAWLNLAYVNFGIKAEAVVINYEQASKSIVSGGIDYDHSVVRYNGVILEPQSGAGKTYSANTVIYYAYSFDDIFTK